MHVDIKGEEGSLAVKNGMTTGTRAAICDDRPMETGLHAAEFTIRKMDRSADDPIMRIGVCVVNSNWVGFQHVDGPGRVKVKKTPLGFDPRVSGKTATSTALGWGYSVANGALRHMNTDVQWAGHRAAGDLDRIKMLLDCDAGSLTLFLNGARLGEMVGHDSGTGLPDLRGKNLAWMVELDKYGDSVSINNV